MKKVKSPLCECEMEDETPQHVVTSCQDLNNEREKLVHLGTTVVEMVIKNKQSPETWKSFCEFVGQIAETKKKQGRKPLKDYFPEKQKKKKKERGPQ